MQRAPRCNMTEGMELISLYELNDDCLMHIFNFLRLKEQVSAALACQRFHAVLSPMWQKEYRKLDLFFKAMLNTSELYLFLSEIRRTVAQIHLYERESFDSIRSLVYPNVKTLKITDHPNEITDNDVFEMTQIFPNLQELVIVGTILTGMHIKNWRFLEHLDISGSETILFDEFEKLLEQLQLKSVVLSQFKQKRAVQWKSLHAFEKFCKLERIAVWWSQLGLLQNLSLFSNIKELKIIPSINKIMKNNDLLNVANNVAEHMRNDLVELVVSKHFPLDALLGRTYDNLQKVTLIKRDRSEFNKIFSMAPNLREIRIMLCQIDMEDIKLCLKFPKMEFVCIQNCKCNFQVLSINVRDFAEHRTRLLRFDFSHNTYGFSRVRLQIIGESPLLVVQNVPSKYWFNFDLQILKFR